MKKIKVIPTVSTITRNYDSRKDNIKGRKPVTVKTKNITQTHQKLTEDAVTIPTKTQYDDKFTSYNSHSSLERPPSYLSHVDTSPASDGSVRHLWQEFRSDTTMHGLKHASQIQKYKLRGTIWAIAVIAMMTLLIYTTYDLFKKYSEHATISNIEIEVVDELPLPSITFCNLSPYKSSAITDPRMSYYFLQMSRLYKYVPPIDFSNPQYSDFHNPIEEGWLQNVSFSVTDLFAVCVSSQDIEISCQDYLTPTVTEWGICYTFNSYDYVQEHGVQMTSVTGSSMAVTLYIRVNQSDYVYNLNLAAGMKILVHDNEEAPDVVNKGFFATPGFTSYASMNLQKHKYLPYPHKSGGGGYCLDTKTSSFINPLRYHKTYSRSACQRECKFNFIFSKCGCKAPTDFGNSTICSLTQIATCYNFWRDTYKRNKTLQACICPQRCEYNVYTASVTTGYFPAQIYHDILSSLGFKELRENYLEVRLFFDTLSYVKVENLPEYTFEKIIASLGGQMGIFLGASLLTITELIEFIILTCMVFFRKMSYCKKQKQSDKSTPVTSMTNERSFY